MASWLMIDGESDNDIEPPFPMHLDWVMILCFE